MILQRIVRSDGIDLSKGDVQEFWLPTGPMLHLSDASFPMKFKLYDHLPQLILRCVQCLGGRPNRISRAHSCQFLFYRIISVQYEKSRLQVNLTFVGLHLRILKLWLGFHRLIKEYK